MLQGRVNQYGEPVVEITLILKGVPRELPAIIDTGFNGYLSVPRPIIGKSGWEFLGFEDYELASGQILRERVYWGSVSFEREPMEVYVVATDSDDILIGTGLLRGKRLVVDFRTGKVRVTGGRR